MKVFTFVDLDDSLHIRDITSAFATSTNIATNVNGYSICMSDDYRRMYFAISDSVIGVSKHLDRVVDYTRKDHWPFEPVLAP